jgi:hypothetical protein
MRLGVQRSGGALALEQSDDEGRADAEDAGDPAERAFVALDRRHDPLAEIQRIGPHGDPSLLHAPDPEMCPSKELFAHATRQ